MHDVKIPFVDTRDIADVAVKVLMDDAHNGKTYEVTGPRTLTFEEVVQEIALGTGKTIQFQPISIEEYNAMMKSAGVPSDYAWLIDYLFREVLTNPDNQVISHDIEKVLGRKATDFSTYVKVTAQTGVWDQSLPQSI